MDKQFSRYGWRWLLPAFGLLAWLSIGCNPQSLSMLLLPFDNKLVEPEYKLITGKDEITLVMIVGFDHPEPRTEIAPVETELAAKLDDMVAKRCVANKHKLKLIPQARIHKYVRQHQSEGDFSLLDVGKHFKADFVLDVNIKSCELYIKKMQPPAYRGVADLKVKIYKTKGKESEIHEVFQKAHHVAYPGKDGYVMADEMPVTQFRAKFIDLLASNVSRMFIAYPEEERHVIEMASDSN